MARRSVVFLIAGWVVIAGAATSALRSPPADAPVPMPAPDPAPPAPVPFAADRAGPAAAPDPFDTARARKYLVQLCEIGPRVSGSTGMTKQQELLKKHFEGHGATVVRQEFQARARSKPQSPVAMANLIASWHPDRKTRVILCAHYDTRPAAHEEPDRGSWSKPFVSANDGTAAVALFMELAHHLKAIPTGVGVDVVLFDGEEYILDPGVPYVREADEYFHGSKHFAAQYAKQKARTGVRYAAAILLDLCCGENARLAVEGYSWTFAPQLVDQVWQTAKAVGAKSFKYEGGFQRAAQVQDDHIALNKAGIPAVDIIDFDYKYWHLLADTPDKVSDAQVAEVAQVLAAWLRLQK